MHSFRSRPLFRHLTLVAVGFALALPVLISSAFSTAAPAYDRAFHGYDSVGTNGFGSTESWAGNLRLFTGPDQSGEAIFAYCIERGMNYPRGVDPDLADANSGFVLIGDVPAARGVPAADRAALGYLLWRYGATDDDRTAAAMFLLTHLLSADPEFGSTTLDSTVLGPDWPDPAAVGARADQLLAEARARRGPWTIDVALEPTIDSEARTGSVTAAATVAGPGGPITGVDVLLAVDAAGDDPVSVSLTTDDTGRAAHALDVTDAMARVSGNTGAVVDAPDVPQTPEPHADTAQGADDSADDPGPVDTSNDPAPILDVSATATIAVTPGGYRVFHGRPGTQQVITNDGDGPAVNADASISIDVPPPPPSTTTTIPPTTTTAPPATTTTVTVPATQPPTTQPPTTQPPPSTAVTQPVRTPPPRPDLPFTGGGSGLAPVALSSLVAGIVLVLTARWMTVRAVTAPAGRRGGAHLRRE